MKKNGEFQPKALLNCKIATMLLLKIKSTEPDSQNKEKKKRKYEQKNRLMLLYGL